MLTFHRARFSNFVLLKDVELRFSEDPQQSVTVVRAENGTGKTTCLKGLEWTLYGDRALPPQAKYSIQPPDWCPSSDPIRVECELEFSVVAQEPRPGGPTETSLERYILVRRAEVSSDANSAAVRRTERPTLLRRAGGGYEPVEEPQSLIDSWLPFALREFFFTDGDKAFAYISADEESARRSRVEGAVRALLHLDLVEATAKRVGSTTLPKLRRQEAKDSGQADLKELSDQMDGLADSIEAKQEERRQRLDEQGQLEGDRARLQAKLDEALEHGNSLKLKEDLRAAREEIAVARKDVQSAERDLSDLLHDPSLEAAILTSQLQTVRTGLTPLHESGRIPASHIPFLRDRLESGVCVCGTNLSHESSARSSLVALLNESEQERATANRLNEIYTEIGDGLRKNNRPTGHWPTRLRKVTERAVRHAETARRFGRRIADLEQKIASLPDTDIQLLTSTLERARRKASSVQAKIMFLDREIASHEERSSDCKQQYEKLLERAHKSRSLRAAIQVATDIQEVLDATLLTLRSKKVAEVSEEMDALFREMIVADSKSGIVRGASLTDGYDVVVDGPTNRKLNPDTELNGASRRALTISFILALAAVSGFAAPNVIDTPLGMISGATRTGLFRVAATHANQLILFLTRSEIMGIEDLLALHVGSWHTLTTMAHHPKQVVRLTGSDTESLICACSYKEFCRVCERQGDADSRRLQPRI